MKWKWPRGTFWTSRNQDMCVFRRSGWKYLKEAEMKEFTLYRGKRLIWPAAIRFFFSNEKGPRGMFRTIVAHFGPPGTPRKRALFQERGRKRMKEWDKVTFMKEWVKALDKTRILAPTHLQNLVSFPRYGRLKKKSRDKIFPNSKYIFLFIELSESYFAGHF